MNINQLVKTLEKFAIDNSPVILTGIGVAGVVSTAVFATKGGIKAARLLEHEGNWDEEYNPEFSLKTKVNLTWKFFIPAGISGAMTITAIVFANRIEHRRAAALAAAFSLSEQAFSEYKEKVKEQIGEKREQKIRDEVNNDRIRKDPPPAGMVISGTDVACKDAYTGRYFAGNMELIKKAQNDTNHQIIHQNYASLNDFYDRVGLARTPIGEEVGWNTDELLDLQITTGLTEDQRPCLVFDFNVVPIRGYHRVH